MTTTLFKTVEGVTPIRVGRRIFVSGLYWQVLPNAQNYIQEAKKIARHERERTGKPLDVVFLRRQVDVVQAGFVVRGGRGRARKGMVSLAAVATDVLGPTFIAALPLPDGRYAMASAIHNAIIPDSDGVHDAHEAKQRMLELWHSLSGSVAANELTVYAPEELWPGAKPIELADLLDGVKRTHKLRQRPSLSSKSSLTWLSWAALVGLAFVGWGLWEQHQNNIIQEQARQRALELEQLRQAAGRQLPDSALMHPWTTQPSVQNFARACTQSIGQIPLTLDGWVLLNAQCSASGTSASFARTEGRTVQGFSREATVWNASADVQFATDGDLGTIHWPIKMEPGVDEPMAPMSDRLEQFMSWWQSRLVPFQTKSVPSSFAKGYRPPADTNDPRLTTPQWKTIQWSIKATPRTPTRLLEPSFQQDGIRLQKVELTFSKDGMLNWNLEGELYGY